MNEATSTAVCALCEGRGWVLEPDGGVGAARRCQCQLLSEGSRLIDAAGIPDRYKHCKLANFSVEVGGKRAALLRARTACTHYLDAFVGGDGRTAESGLLLVGPPGVGKTHLAAAVLTELIRRYHVRGIFVDCSTLIHQIQSTFDPDGGSKSQILDPVLRCDVLVLDELGSLKPTAWVGDILYLILNTRYTERRPTIVTTNYRLPAAAALEGLEAQLAPDRLASRIPPSLVSRLYEMARIVEVDGDDFRRTVKVHQHTN